MIKFIMTNSNGMIELTKKEFKEIITKAYNEGYEKGVEDTNLKLLSDIPLTNLAATPNATNKTETKKEKEENAETKISDKEITSVSELVSDGTKHVEGVTEDGIEYSIDTEETPTYTSQTIKASKSYSDDFSEFINFMKRYFS